MKIRIFSLGILIGAFYLLVGTPNPNKVEDSLIDFLSQYPQADLSKSLKAWYGGETICLVAHPAGVRAQHDLVLFIDAVNFSFRSKFRV